VDEYEQKGITMETKFPNPEIETSTQTFGELLFELENEIERMENFLTVAKRIRDYVKVLTQEIQGMRNIK